MVYSFSLMDKCIVVGILLLLFVSCDEERKEIDTYTPKHIVLQATDNIAYADTTKSLVTFIGHKRFVGTEHEGFFKLKSGVIFLNKNNEICGGKLVWNINSIKLTEADSITKKKLLSVLLSEDFFKSERYPESVFLIDSVYTTDAPNSTHIVSGNLQIGDTYRYISMPVNITKDGKSSQWVKGNFDIFRKDWNLYFSNKNSLEDKIIQDRVHIGILVNIREG